MREWTLATRLAAYRIRFDPFGPRLSADATRRTMRAWHGLRWRLETVDPVVTRALAEIEQAVRGSPRALVPADAADGRALADSLEGALRNGVVRLDEVPRAAVNARLPGEAADPASAAAPALVEVDVVLVDDAGGAVVGQSYELKLPDGRIITGLTDARGHVWAPPTQRGTCELTFPRLDQDAWDAG